MTKGTNRRNLLIFAGTIMLSSNVLAQEYPIRPVTLIVPFTAGGPTDVTMRVIADAAAKHLGQPIIIENRTGGSGTVGPASMAAGAKPDGYTISQMPIPVFRLPLMQHTTWSIDDFSYIIHLTGYVFSTYAGASTPFKTWQDVLDYAKQNPGKVTYGTPGAGGSLHIGMEMITARAGVKFTHVPFKGSTEVDAAVAGGHVMLGASGLNIRPLVDAGKARFLNVWTQKRVPSLPDVPTLHDLGYPFTFDSPFGIAGPKGMNPVVVEKIHNAFKKALDEQPVVETLARYDMLPNYKNSADYRASVLNLINTEAAALERIGLVKR